MTFRRWVGKDRRRRGGDDRRDRTRESIKRMPAQQKAELIAETIAEVVTLGGDD